MPRRKWIDKKTASHFTLVHRPQNDPLIHDESAPSMVLNPTQLPNASKVKRLDDLASELGSETESVRDNEGEAANYGIYYDDTEYDYMQHLRDLGSGSGEAVFIETTASRNAESGKGKHKQSLEDALRQMELEGRSEELLDEDILPSKNLQRLTYQSQQDVPDTIAGFQPDMDPRLREVLEALEDEAYVEEDEDLFQALAKDAKELNTREFEEVLAEDDDDEDGWESDHTAKPDHEDKDDQVPELVDVSQSSAAENSQNWLADFNAFKKDQKVGGGKAGAAEKFAAESSIWTTTTNGGKRKKRKGALTSQTGYSMTSSSLVRTEQLTILDARFEKLEEEYNEGEDDLASASGVSSVSSVQGPVRSDFDGIMDEFLGSQPSYGRQNARRGKGNAGVQELDQIRRDLGPARVKSRYK